MSIPVPIEELADAAARYTQAPFLLTTSDDARPHAIQVEVSVRGAAVSCDVGRRTGHNSLERPLVSLLWPPTESGGYSLIADGEMSVSGTPGDGATGTIIVSNAVLHRPASVG